MIEKEVMTKKVTPFQIPLKIKKSYSRMYEKKSQKAMESKYLLTGVINSTSSSSNYFAKGHLSPDAAFVYQREQDATYYFINVAPQFQSFNAGNWRFLEEGVRELAKRY